jgi:hypothetical protein
MPNILKSQYEKPLFSAGREGVPAPDPQYGEATLIAIEETRVREETARNAVEESTKRERKPMSSEKLQALSEAAAKKPKGVPLTQAEIDLVLAKF